MANMQDPFMEISKACILPDEFCNSIGALSLSIFTCIIIMSIFLLMKRYTHCLTPYLGHMKIPKKASGNAQ